MAARTRQEAQTPAAACTNTSAACWDARSARRGTGRLAPAVLRAQLDVLAAEERRVRIVEPPAPPPLNVSEAAFQRLVTDLAEWCGWQTYHTHDSRRSDAGFPDLVLVRTCAPRQLVIAELKTESGRLRPEQRRWGQLLLAAGVDYRVWRPSGWTVEIVPTLTAERGEHGQG